MTLCTNTDLKPVFGDPRDYEEVFNRYTISLYCMNAEAPQWRPEASRVFAGGRQSRPSSQQTSGVQRGAGDTSGGVIRCQTHRVKQQADPAATQGHDASHSTRQYLFINDNS